jgi:signal transduction histidine kinase
LKLSTSFDLVNSPLFKLYNFEPHDLSISRLNEELTKNDSYSQELSFKTLKQNIFWGKLIQKNVTFNNLDYTILKVAKSANYLREEQWLAEVLKISNRGTGRQFFKDLTQFLCRTLNARNAFIARRVANDDSRLKIFYWHGKKLNTHYISIKNSFVENTLRGYASYYPDGLRELFPKDEVVKQTSARSFIGSPVFDVSGEAFGIIGVLSDTAMEELPNSRYMLSILSSRAASEIQRIRSKELLRQQTRELAEINLMKDKLISVITTDLHAPLNTILGYSDMLKNKSRNYSATEMATKMKAMDNTIRNLYVFLENLADWNKLQQNEMKASITTCNLVNMVNDTKPYYGYLADLKKITIKNKVPAAIYIQGDSYLARVAIRNTATYLIKNTMKSGSVIFDTQIRDGKWYFIVESDNFTADIEDVKFCLSALPQELYNASKEASVPVLGLFIAREFCSLQGGKISYEVEANKLRVIFEIKKAV